MRATCPDCDTTYDVDPRPNTLTVHSCLASAQRITAEMFRDIHTGRLAFPSRCTKHPRYKGVHPPRPSGNFPEGCEQCWGVYERAHPSE